MNEGHTMEPSVCYLAQGGALPGSPVPKEVNAPIFSPEVTAILVIAAVLAALLFIWALFIRKPRHPDPRAQALEAGADPAPADPGASEHRHGRRRHRRREHSSQRRNPTLHETGGLPPPRPDDVPPRY